LKTTVHTTVDDFLRDDDFIRYVMDAIPDSDSRWASYLSAAPAVRSAYLKAYDILNHLDDCHLLSPEEKATLKQRVIHTIRLSYN